MEIPRATNLLRGRAANLFAFEGDAAFTRLEQSGDRAQRRCLAGAVGANQRDDLALLDPALEMPRSASIAP